MEVAKEGLSLLSKEVFGDQEKGEVEDGDLHPDTQDGIYAEERASVLSGGDFGSDFEELDSVITF